MISVSGKKWEQKKTDRNLVEKLKQDFNFSDVLSSLALKTIITAATKSVFNQHTY